MDFNCPVKDGAVTDNTRIRAALPTIKYLRERGARVVLLSHLGRPKGGPDPKYSMQPVVRELERLLGAPVTFLADPTSEEAVTATRRLPRGGVAVGENTRFYPGEEKNDPALAERFAALGDFYVNDAFGSAHRAHASTEAVARLLKPAVSGFLMQQELRYLGEALHQPEAAVRRRAGRRQDQRQDRSHRGAPAQGGRHPARRRHGLHLLPGDGARDRDTRWSRRTGSTWRGSSWRRRAASWCCRRAR